MDWTAFLKRVKLIDNFEHEIGLPKAEFIQKMSEYVRPEPKGFFARVKKLLSHSKRPYLGLVESDGFYIRRRVKYQEGFRYMIRVQGEFDDLGESVRIRSTMNGVNPQVIWLIVLKNLFYVFAVILALRSTASILDSKFLFFLGLLIPIAMVVFIPYFIMRYYLQRSKDLYKREFDYIAAGPHN